MLSATAWAGNDLADTNAINDQELLESLHIRAEHGDADALFQMGKCLRDGVGLPQDKAAAVKWFEKAAKQGIVEAQMMVGINYWLGIDVKMDEAKGIAWFQKAADQGEPGAFHFLGAAYYLGKGVKQDYVQCYKWTLLFKDSGHSVIPDDDASIAKQQAELEAKMTTEQKAEGKRLAKEAETRLSKFPRFSEKQ